MLKIGFDTEKYLKEQSEQILKRVEENDKLYLEFGGKLIGDKHAARVLPGFDEDAKLKLISQVKDQAEIIICVYTRDIEDNKIRGDYGITYDLEVMRLIDEYRAADIEVNSVLLTRYSGQKNAEIFKKNLERRGIKVYTHAEIKGYPTDTDILFSDEGFAGNDYIPTTKPLVVVTGPGAGSGKLSTCLSQLFHDHQQGLRASYAKFETFPVWNLGLKHPLNIAYEAATVDINDTIVIDNYHYEAYGEYAVNYNRDVQMFPVVRRILSNITGENPPYESPTDMGVNCIKDGIIDEEVIIEASKQEIIRRYFDVESKYKVGIASDDERDRMQLIMEELALKPEDRTAVLPAREYAGELKERFQLDNAPATIAIELPTGVMETGRTSSIMDATAAAVMNSLKELAGIADQIDLLAPMVLETIQALKTEELQSRTPTLTLNELLIALAISAVTNPTAKLAYDELESLKHSQAHSTVILSKENEQALKSLGIDVTADPNHPSDQLLY